MNPVLLAFWTVLVAASVAWYAFLVFHVGWKAGREIRELTEALRGPEEPGRKPR